MEPLINPNKPLRLFELGPAGFQELCRTMFRELPEVQSANMYGLNGQSQRGVDIDVSLRSGRRWVGQCKACEINVLKHLKQAVDDFLPHLDFWKGNGVEKFIVLIGRGAEDTKALDARREYERQFAARGLAFELWDSSEIRRALRPMRAVVEQFLPKWLDEICGREPTITLSAHTESQPSVSSALIAELGTTHNQRLDEIRDLIRVGKESKAESELRKMPSSAAWNLLPASLQARVYRMLVGIVLNRRNDVDGARKFLEKAKEVYPAGRFVVTETTIRHRAEGAAAALEGMPEAADRDEWNLRAALLLNANRAEEALRLLEAPAFEPDADTLRLRALAHLFRKEVDQARVLAAEAEAKASNWILVQQTLALTEYFTAISPGFVGWNHWNWPLPVSWHLIRSDAKSRTALRRAGERFSAIARDQQKGSEEWQHTMGWQLACLANDSARHVEASDLARQILAVCPAAFAAVVWATTRDYEFDKEASRVALEKYCKEGTTTEPVQALFSLLLVQEKFPEAGMLLDSYRKSYERAGLLDAWCYQRAQVYVIEGKPQQAKTLIEQQTDTDLRERTRVALDRIGPQRTNLWSTDALAALDALFRRTNSDSDLFEACEAHHFAGQNDYVIEHAQELIRRLNTEPALHLCLDAAISARRYSFCLKLMEEHRTIFRDGEFPPVVRRLRATCLRLLGRLLEAEQELQLLTGEKGSAEDRYELFRLQLTRGKVTEAAATARTLLDDPHVTTEGLLQIADSLRPEDPDLARTFFKHAKQRGVDSPTAAALGMNVGFNLGLDDQITDMVSTALPSAGNPESPLKPFTIDQIIELQRKFDESRSALETDYNHGRIPVHILAQSAREPLAAFIHLRSTFIEAADEPFSQLWSLRVRYGARYEPIKITRTSDTRLFLDVTSLILAAHIDILDSLEKEYAPIGISPWVMELLRTSLGTLTSGQPARIPPKEEVLEMIAAAVVKVVNLEGESVGTLDKELGSKMGDRWCRLFCFAQRSRGWLVDFLPLTTNDESHTLMEIPKAIDAHLRGVGDVVMALKEHGDLSLTQEGIAQLRLGSMCNDHRGEMQGGDGKVLVLEHGIAEQLANAGLLRMLGKRFNVYIGSDEPEALKAELKHLATREQLIHWLRALRERIRTGLDSGSYLEEPSPQENDTVKTPEVRCLCDFLNAARPESTLSCCDDRMLSRVYMLGKSSVVGLFDLLWHLAGQGKITMPDLFGVLHRLRRSNLRYLPLSTDELLHHLQHAKVENAELVETPELATIRRYIAGCLLDWDLMLRLPPNHPEAQDKSEILFIPAVQRVVGAALVKIWNDSKTDPTRCAAISDWLLDSLWFDLAALPTFSTVERRPPNKALVGMSEAHLALEALQITKKATKSQPVGQRTFLAWLFSRLGAEPRRIKKLVSALKRALLLMTKECGPKYDRAIVSDVIRRYLDNTPSTVKSAVRFSKAELRVLLWTEFSPVTFGNVEFDGKMFWLAAQRALNGTPAVIDANIPRAKKFKIEADRTTPEPAFFIADEPPQSLHFRTADPLFGLLAISPAKRLGCLEKLRRVLDQSSADAKATFRKLAEKKPVDLRMCAGLQLRASSFANQLDAIRNKLIREQKLDLVVARPIGQDSLLRHLRLPTVLTEVDIPTRLEKSAMTLLRDEGFEEAFDRVATLPLLMPTTLSDAFRELTVEERSRFRERFTNPACPLLSFQAAGLLLNGDEADQQSAAKILVALAADDGRDVWHLFESILLWADSCLLSDSANIAACSKSRIAAAWIHASRIHQLIGTPDAPEELTALFKANVTPPAVAAFEHVSLIDDATHPRNFSSVRLLLFGLSHYLPKVNMAELLNGELSESFKKMSFPTNLQGLPSLELLEQRSLPNSLGSFLGTCNAQGLSKILGVEEVSKLSDATMVKLVNESLEMLATKSDNGEAWIGLATYLKTHRPTPEQYSKLRDIIVGFSVQKLANPTLPQLQLLGIFCFGQAANLRASIDWGIWEAKLFDFMEVLANPQMRFATQESGSLLVNCAFLLSQYWEDPTEGATHCTALAGQISSRWPVVAEAFLQPLVRLLLRQPSEVHVNAWRGLTEVRCAAAHIRSVREDAAAA
jgi:hypothetical protein